MFSPRRATSVASARTSAPVALFCRAGWGGEARFGHAVQLSGTALRRLNGGIKEANETALATYRARRSPSPSKVERTPIVLITVLIVGNGPDVEVRWG